MGSSSKFRTSIEESTPSVGDPIVIIGAGQAGVSLAVKLRDLRYDGGIALVGDEPAPPYQRPPLSKKHLSGELTFDRLLLRPANWYRDHNIELLTGCAATSAAFGQSPHRPGQRGAQPGQGARAPGPRYSALACRSAENEGNTDRSEIIIGTLE
jgi:hypothetical protein